MLNASNNWSAAAGPQLLSWYSYHENHWVYVQCDWSLPAGTKAWTDRCGYHQFGYGCLGTLFGGMQQLAYAVDIDYGVIWMNANTQTSSSAGRTIAHEIGHVLGLHHHSPDSDCSVVMQVNNCGNWSGPRSGDIGFNPACGGSTQQYGIRCIYGW